MDILKLTKLSIVDQGLISPMLSPKYHTENTHIPKDWAHTFISLHSPKQNILKAGLKSLSIHNRTGVTLHFFSNILATEQVKPSRTPETYDSVQKRIEINS